MGGIPSRDAHTTFFSLRYGTHEVGLIPLVRRYFNKKNVELRNQFIRMRNDPSVRYNFMRDPKYPMTELPPPTYTEEDLERFLDNVEGRLYNSTREMLADEDGLLCPVPCAVCFIYVNGREGADCFSFYGRRINIIGQFGCYMYDDEDHDEDKKNENNNKPKLYLQKVILKAAGDRTMEKVVTIAAKTLCQQFLCAASILTPEKDAMEMFKRRISRLSLITETPWNSYPALKFLHDTVVLAWAVGNIQNLNDSPKFYTSEVGKSGQNVLVMELDGSLLLKSITWLCTTLISSALRVSWEQFMLNDAILQDKEKKVNLWLETSPFVQNFLGDELTLCVQNHLVTLLGEVVRARQTPCDDLTLWSAEKECSHDGKVYRIFNSPLCGPFITTVKVKKEQEEDDEEEKNKKKAEEEKRNKNKIKTNGFFDDVIEINKSNNGFISSSNNNNNNFINTIYSSSSSSNNNNNNNFDNDGSCFYYGGYNGGCGSSSSKNPHGFSSNDIDLLISSTTNSDETDNYFITKKLKQHTKKEQVGKLRSPPKYQEAVKNVFLSSTSPSTPFISTSQTVCPVTLTTCNLPPPPPPPPPPPLPLPPTNNNNNNNSVSMQLPSVMMMPFGSNEGQRNLNMSSSPTQFMPTFMPVYSESVTSTSFPIQQVVMPSYVVLNNNNNNNNNNNLSSSSCRQAIQSQQLQEPTKFISINQNNMATNGNNTFGDEWMSVSQTQPVISQPLHVENNNNNNKTITAAATTDVGSLFAPQLLNYVLLPYGRIGVLNSPSVPLMSYWGN